MHTADLPLSACPGGDNGCTSQSAACCCLFCDAMQPAQQHLHTKQTALGFTINFPTGLTTNVINDVSVLTNANGVRIADVLLTDSYKSYTTAQRSAIVSFVQAGAGLVLGGQAWCVCGVRLQRPHSEVLEASRSFGKAWQLRTWQKFILKLLCTLLAAGCLWHACSRALSYPLPCYISLFCGKHALPVVCCTTPHRTTNPRRSTGGNITQYNGNLLLEPLNCIRWTADYGDARSIYVGVAPPDPMSFNADLSAAALLDHLKGTTLLAADVLAKGVCAAVFGQQLVLFDTL